MQSWVRIACVGALWLAFAGAAEAQSARRLYDQGVRAERAQDSATARNHFRAACDAGHAAACHNLGNMLADGRGGGIDEVGARHRYELGCSRGLMVACSNFAIMLNTGRGGARDQVRAREVFSQACDRRDVSGCSSLGNMMVRGEGGPTEMARGRSLLQTACNGGDDWSCRRIANLDAGGGQPTATVTAQTLQQGLAAFQAQNFSEAMRLLGGHAQAGNARAQYTIGHMHTFGQGTGRDYLRAADFLTRAAEQGNTEAQDLLIRIAPNIAQARFIDHIDRHGPDATNLQTFSNDVFDYCALRGPNCSALQARRSRMERDHNARAEAENMARIWRQYGSGQNQQDFWSASRARSECLRRVMRSTEAQTRGRQDWRYVNNC